MTEANRQKIVPDEPPASYHDGMAVRISLENEESAVETGRVAILDYLAPLALSGLVINRIEVVFEELVGNLIRHGVAESITVDILARPHEIELAVEDDGPEFNPLELTMPSRFTTLEEAELGGLGIPLIRRLSRSIHYDRVEPVDDADELPRNRVVVTISRE